MKTGEFVFNLVNRIPTKEEYEKYLGLANREEIDKIGQLALYLKKEEYGYRRIYLKDGIPPKLRKYIDSLGIKEEDFPEGIPTSIRAYMEEKGIEEPDFRYDIIDKLESTNCTFTDLTIKDRYQKKIEYFIELKMEVDNNVIPAIKSIKDESAFEDAGPIADLEDWLKSNLKVLEFDLEDPSVKLKKSILGKGYSKKGLTFEEKISLELVEFSMDKGLAKIGVCENCGHFFLWANKSTKYCSDSCKSRRSEANKDKKK